MKTITLKKIENLDFDLKRKITDVTFAPTVLSTEFVPISRFDQFKQKMAQYELNRIKEEPNLSAI